jgi:hypothetical protein
MAVGVDVHCYYQRGIRWNEVSGVGYVWVKVSDGTAPYTKTVGGVTYRPDTHVAGAKSRGIPVGGYHYAQPGDPRAQADLLIREVKRLGATGVLPALDIEAPFEANAAARSFGEAFCNRVRELGFRPVVYMSDSFAKALQPASWASQPVLWIARYGSKPVNTRFDIHQYSSSLSLPGSAGAVDFNDSYNNNHLNMGSVSAPTGGGFDDVSLDDKIKTWGGQELTLRDLLRDVQGRVADVRSAHYGDPAQNTGDGGDPFGVFVFTDNPGQPNQRSIRMRDLLGELRTQANRIDDVEGKLDQVLTLVGKTTGVSSEDLAQALLPGLTEAIKEQLADVGGLDEDAVAAKLATDLAARLAS